MNSEPFTWPGRLEGDPAHDLIHAYLVIDIQNSPKGTDELLEMINQVKEGRLPCWERIGNAYTLSLFPDHIKIETDNDFADEPCGVVMASLDDFKKAVSAWKALIGTKRG
ncbi:MAG: hypothetical protein ACU83U_00750 [Gammaproteobacteria bacterium]